jgi:flagellar motor switch/type III secretory pathway protein FliN
MSELTPELAADVVAACEAGAEEAAGALSRSLDGEFAMAVGEAGSYSADSAPAGFDGPGLAILMKFGDVGVTAFLPEACGLLPDWYADPDPTGESKLSTLAQELSMLLVPETLMADDFQAMRIDNFGEALAAAKVANDAALVPLELTAGENTGQLSLIWPLAEPSGLFPVPEEVAEETVAAAPPGEASSPGHTVSVGADDFSQLPDYTRSLLRIELPVRVVLASKKEDLKHIVELASGSIIKFDKACDEMLHLQVGDQHVALGEAVKVGDKFGFRVSSIVLPDEHFSKVQPKKTG